MGHCVSQAVITTWRATVMSEKHGRVLALPVKTKLLTAVSCRGERPTFTAQSVFPRLVLSSEGCVFFRHHVENVSALHRVPTSF